MRGAGKNGAVRAQCPNIRFPARRLRESEGLAPCELTSRQKKSPTGCRSGLAPVVPVPLCRNRPGVPFHLARLPRHRGATKKRCYPLVPRWSRDCVRSGEADRCCPGWAGCRQSRHDADRGRNARPHADTPADYVGQTYRLHLDPVVAAKGQNSLQQVARALTRAVNDLKIGPLAAAFGRSPGSDLGERQHRSKCVVKVMCDTARQEADGFQPLRLAQLYFTLVLSCVCTLLVAAAGAPKRIPEALSPDL
jgi:hypothetical protein